VGVSAAAEAIAPDDAEAGPISPLVAALLAVVGVFAFSALVVLVTYASDLRQNGGGADALSKSAVGYAALVEALKLSGTPVVLNRDSLPPHRSSGLFVVMPGPSADLGAVTALGFEGTTLVVLPKWLVTPDPQHRGWVRKLDLAGTAFRPIIQDRQGLLARTHAAKAGPAAPGLRAVDGPFEVGAVLQTGPVEDLQVFDGSPTASRKGGPAKPAPSHWKPVLVDGAGETVLARQVDKPIYVLAEPDLMNNHGLADERTFATALAIVQGLEHDDGPVIFDLRLSGLGRERSPMRLLFDPPFLGVTLCLAAAAGLAGWQAFARFGPARRAGRAIALGKTALVDNSAGLIRLAGREHRMAARYVEVTTDLAARAVGAPRRLSGEALIAFLDRMAIHRGAAERLDDLALEARLASTAQRAAGVAQRLFRWRRAVTGESQ
jgi:hypothetical protein